MWIYVLEDKDKNIHVGRSSNTAKAISNYNTDLNGNIKRIIGVKAATRDRTVEGVIKIFEDRGHNVIRAWTRMDKAKQRKSRRIDAQVAEALAKDKD